MARIPFRNNSRNPQTIPFQGRSGDSRSPLGPTVGRSFYDWLDGVSSVDFGSRGGSSDGGKRVNPAPLTADLDFLTYSDNPVGEPYGKDNVKDFDPNNPWDWLKASYGASKGDAAAWLANAFSAAQVQQQMQFQNEQSNIAWNRQRYSEDLAYDRTKFATLYNQYLAAGMSPAAALQAASGSSPDVSGSSPAPAAGSLGSPTPNSDPYAAAKLGLDAAGSLMSFGSSIAGIAAQYASLKQQKSIFDRSIAEDIRQFDVQNFDAVQAYDGSNLFYKETAPLFFKRDSKGVLPFSWLSDSSLSSHKILDSLSPFREDFPELVDSLEKNADNPYYQAALRDFMKSQLGVRAYTANQRNLNLQNDFLKDKITAQGIANSVANLSLAEYNASIYGYLNYVVSTDSSFRNKYGIYQRGDDWVISEVTLNDGTVESDVRLTDYIGYMENGYISNMSLQGLSYLDLLGFTAQYQSLTLQTDLDLYNHNKATLINSAKSAEFLSALDALTNESVYSYIKDNPAYENLIKFRGAMDRTGISSAAKWTAEKGIELYGIRSGNKNAAASRAQQQEFFDQNLQQRQYEFDNRGFTEDSWFDESTKMHHKVRR